MALQGTARATVPAVPAIPSPSVSQGSVLTLVFRELGNISNFAVAVGTSTGPPATLAGLAHNPGVYGLLDALTSQFTYNGGSGYSGQLTLTVPAVAGAAAGNNWWVCIFENSSPVGTDAPDLVIGPVPLVA